jgi:hypothetical protein
MHFARQSHTVQSNWAAEHLLVIRTLMERSAIYRRALAPIVLALGAAGVVAALLGWIIGIGAPRSFVAYWSGVGLAGVSAAYLMARQQALKAGEPFWSAPTRRVTQALLPPLFVGVIGSAVAACIPSGPGWPAAWIVPLWMVLYGFAMHAAGFFMPRGMKLFGWVFILVGCLVAARFGRFGAITAFSTAHLLMGASFGGLHLAYGLYLYFTEKRKNEP